MNHYHFHDLLVNLILSESANYIIGTLAIILFIIYFLMFWLLKPGFMILDKQRRKRFLMLGVNWLVFGIVFLSFGILVDLHDVRAWRASARLALIFFILSEMGYQLMTLAPVMRNKLWKRH
jgi:hypothetical protein